MCETKVASVSFLHIIKYHIISLHVTTDDLMQPQRWCLHLSTEVISILQPCSTSFQNLKIWTKKFCCFCSNPVELTALTVCEHHTDQLCALLKTVQFFRAYKTLTLSPFTLKDCCSNTYILTYLLNEAKQTKPLSVYTAYKLWTSCEGYPATIL